MIDEDLGRSGSEHPGFQRLLADVCSGDAGAVLCIEASRLARNGRDWHHLIELCGMVGAVIIDPDGVYDPALINDRPLLGLRGTMSEFELKSDSTAIIGSNSSEDTARRAAILPARGFLPGPRMTKSRLTQIVECSRRFTSCFRR